MARFIPISVFSSLYQSTSDLLDSNKFSQFSIELNEKGKEIALSNGYSSEDFNAFVQSVQHPSAIVFHGWVEQEKYLTTVLSGKLPEIEYLDKKSYLKHQLTDEFKVFISPFLSNALLSLHPQTDAQLRIAFSGVQLLKNDDRILIENQFFQPIQERLKSLEETAYNSTDEDQILKELQPLCDDDIISCVNYLSRRSYDKRITFIDSFLTTLKSNGCTPRLANWTLKQLEKIELNPEHQEKIYNLKKELKSGSLKVKNTGKGTTPIRWSSILTVLLLFGVVGITGYLLIWKKAPKPDDDIAQNELSGFKDFTIEERKKIDSLLKTLERENPFETYNSDSILIIDQGVSIKMRSAFRNKKMESIYDDLSKDLELYENYPALKCDNPTTYTATHNTKDLNSYDGEHTVMFKNESEYDVVIYVASMSKKDQVFTAFVKANSSIVFMINEEDILTAVSGKKYRTFELPELAEEEEAPSESLTHHFCEKDVNYGESMNRSYTFVKPVKSKSKLLFTTDDDGFVHLIDVHDSFENF